MEKEPLDKLISNLENIKNMNFKENLAFEDFNFIKDFFNKEKTVENVFDRLKLFLILETIEDQNLKIKWIDFLIFNKTLETLCSSDVFGLTIISLLRMKEAPNYNILPKVIGSNIKYSKVLDILFGESVGALKPVTLVEYFRQKELSVELSIIYLIKTKVIDWFRTYEPKSSLWYIDFLDTNPKDFDFKNEIDKIINLVK